MAALKNKNFQNRFYKLTGVLLVILVVFSSRLLWVESQMPELPHVVRFVEAYEKREDGYLVQDYLLKPISIRKLRSFFNMNDIQENTYERAVARDMVGIYAIDEKTAKLLQPYINAEIHLDKYDYFLGARFRKDYQAPKNAEYYLPPEDGIFPGFPDARPIKPKYRESSP